MFTPKSTALPESPVKIGALITATIAVFAPIQTVLLTAMVLLTADLITGVLAAYKRGEKISSAGFGRTIAKAFVFQAVIMLGFLTETYLTGASIPVCKIITSYIGLTELTSIVENMNSISGGSLLKALLAKLSSKNLENND